MKRQKIKTSSFIILIRQKKPSLDFDKRRKERDEDTLLLQEV